MSRLTFTRARAVRRALRRGYTLAELLASMTLLAIVGTVISKLMLGQQRYYQRQASQMGVRRELRTSMSVLPADLRSLSSSGGDLLNFSTTSITFRNVLGASIVCARPNNTTMDLPPLDMARNTLTSWYTQPQIGDSVFAFNEGLSRGAEDDVWTGMRITAISPSAAHCPLSVFTDAALDAGKSRWRVSVTPAMPDSVKIGAGVRFVRSTRYSLEASATSNYYLSRSEYLAGAWSVATPIAGPFVAPNASGTGGMQFAYFDSLGTTVTNVANSRSVSRIDVILRVQGANTSTPGSGGIVKDSLTFRIALRNRQ